MCSAHALCPPTHLCVPYNSSSIIRGSHEPTKCPPWQQQLSPWRHTSCHPPWRRSWWCRCVRITPSPPWDVDHVQLLGTHPHSIQEREDVKIYTLTTTCQAHEYLWLIKKINKKTQRLCNHIKKKITNQHYDDQYHCLNFLPLLLNTVGEITY